MWLRHCVDVRPGGIQTARPGGAAGRNLPGCRNAAHRRHRTSALSRGRELPVEDPDHERLRTPAPANSAETGRGARPSSGGNNGQAAAGRYRPKNSRRSLPPGLRPGPVAPNALVNHRIRGTSIGWQGQYRGGPATGYAVDPNASSVQFGQKPRERQSQARALKLPRQLVVELDEPRKSPLHRLGLHPDAVIFDADGDVVAVPKPNHDPNAASIRAELHGVG